MCTTRFRLAAHLLNNYINIFLFIDKSTLCNYPDDDTLCKLLFKKLLAFVSDKNHSL